MYVSSVHILKKGTQDQMLQQQKGRLEQSGEPTEFINSRYDSISESCGSLFDELLHLHMACKVSCAKCSRRWISMVGDESASGGG